MAKITLDQKRSTTTATSEFSLLKPVSATGYSRSCSPWVAFSCRWGGFRCVCLSSPRLLRRLVPERCLVQKEEPYAPESHKKSPSVQHATPLKTLASEKVQALALDETLARRYPLLDWKNITVGHNLPHMRIATWPQRGYNAACCSTAKITNGTVRATSSA